MTQQATPAVATAPARNLDDLIAQTEVTPEEAAELAGQAAAPPLEPDPEDEPSAEQVEAAQQIPEWAIVPATLKVPPDRDFAILRFRAKWTHRPSKGDRQCILWSLSDLDERTALKRARGDSSRGLPELAKQMIRLIDGEPAEWTMGRASKNSVDKFWDEIGPKCRKILTNHYLQTHGLDPKEVADFFTNCCVVRSAVVG